MGQLAAEKAAAEKRARDLTVFQDEQIKKLKAELAEARAAKQIAVNTCRSVKGRRSL